LLNKIVRKWQTTIDYRLEESYLRRIRLPKGHLNIANNNPPSLNVNKLMAYALAKVKARVLS
jgi:hypothetical protein